MSTPTLHEAPSAASVLASTTLAPSSTQPSVLPGGGSPVSAPPFKINIQQVVAFVVSLLKQANEMTPSKKTIHLRLIQGLVNGEVSIESILSKFERRDNVFFLIKNIPLLRDLMMRGKLHIQGINRPTQKPGKIGPIRTYGKVKKIDK
ncbi:hypothetical protein pipiens_017006 [Culex pipiens pipiens]|uniref:Uncharacterized protein n=1 Tax=Culex pipiens pipiens TaxID=38569 RepID=A0ABD1CIU1_CULPP